MNGTRSQKKKALGLGKKQKGGTIIISEDPFKMMDRLELIVRGKVAGIFSTASQDEATAIIDNLKKGGHITQDQAQKMVKKLWG